MWWLSIFLFDPFQRLWQKSFKVTWFLFGRFKSKKKCFWNFWIFDKTSRFKYSSHLHKYLIFFQDLAFKNQLCKEQQEKRFEQERTILVKNYENELQSMIDQQKKQVEKAEEQQHVDLKVIFNSECKKVPFWQFFRKGRDGRALLVTPSRIPHRISMRFCFGFL